MEHRAVTEAEAWLPRLCEDLSADLEKLEHLYTTCHSKVTAYGRLNYEIGALPDSIHDMIGFAQQLFGFASCLRTADLDTVKAELWSPFAGFRGGLGQLYGNFARGARRAFDIVDELNSRVIQVPNADGQGHVKHPDFQPVLRSFTNMTYLFIQFQSIFGDMAEAGRGIFWVAGTNRLHLDDFAPPNLLPLGIIQSLFARDYTPEGGPRLSTLRLQIGEVESWEDYRPTSDEMEDDDEGDEEDE